MGGKTRKVDVAIIGAGTAGLAAFREAEKTTRDILLINDGPYGTTCARVGCMPSKVLIQLANDFHRRHGFAAKGIRGGKSLKLDDKAALRFVRSLRDHFVSGVLKRIREIGDRNLEGRAQFIGPNTLAVGKYIVEAKSIVIATGSTPRIPEPWNVVASRLLTTDSLFELPSLPRSIAVVGLGTIGLELGQALHRLGVNVVGIGRSRKVAGITDPVINDIARKLFASEMDLWLGNEPLLKAGKVGVRISAGKNVASVERVLASVGRKPNLEGLGLEELGVILNKDGVPDFNKESLQIGNLPVYLAGDANANRSTLHEAADEGRIAGRNSARGIQPSERRTPLEITFTDPNVASVGNKFEELDLKTVSIGEVRFEDQGRSRILGENQGALRVYADRKTGILLGSEMLAPAGEHLAHLLASFIQQKMTVQDALKLPFYHPTVEEGLRTALRNIKSAS